VFDGGVVAVDGQDFADQFDFDWIAGVFIAAGFIRFEEPDGITDCKGGDLSGLLLPDFFGSVHGNLRYVLDLLEVQAGKFQARFGIDHGVSLGFFPCLDNDPPLAVFVDGPAGTSMEVTDGQATDLLLGAVGPVGSSVGHSGLLW
jgi:hypothetical protein